MSDKAFLFLGYSLADWNFRVMLDLLASASNNSEEQRSWAIQLNPDEVEARLWDKKGVNLYNLDLGMFTARLASEWRRSGTRQYMDRLPQSPAYDEEAVICPYMGLASFKFEDAKYFFGRGKDARKIVDHITNLTLTVLVGASGAGKSSILNAAVPKALADIRKRTLIVPFAEWYPGFYAKLCADVSRVVLTKLDSLHPERSAPRSAVPDGQAGSPTSFPADPRSQSLERSSTQWVRTSRTPVFFFFDQFEQYFINRRASVQTNIDAGRLRRYGTDQSADMRAGARPEHAGEHDAASDVRRIRRRLASAGGCCRRSRPALGRQRQRLSGGRHLQWA